MFTDNQPVSSCMDGFEQQSCESNLNQDSTIFNMHGFGQNLLN